VFVDDGSTDRTVDRLREIYQDDKNSMIVEHGRNRGIGAAFRTGFEKCKGGFVCTIDADCTYQPEGLVQLISLLENTGADVAFASPYHPEGRLEGVPPWRLLLSRSCSFMYRLLSGVRLYTSTIALRAYRRSVIETVRFHSDGFVSAAEIVVEAAHQGYRIVEAPMILRAR